MCARWKEGYNPDVVTTGLEKIKSISENGEVTFTGFEFDDYAAVLLSSLSLSSTLPDRYKLQIIHKGIFNVAKSKKLTVSALLQEISKLEQAYLREPIKQYLLVSDISLHIPADRARVEIGGKSITFSRRLRSKIQRDVFLKLGREFLERDLPKSYSCVQILTSGRSPEEAGILALETIDLLRGIWNFALNRKKHIIFHAGKRDPVNKILLGPLHSVHSPDGKRLPDPFWYDPTYVGPVVPIDLTKKWCELRRFERLVRRRLSRSPSKQSKQFLEEAFRRYARALDERSHENSFLKLWSLLEYLTRTMNQSYDVTIKRAVSLWSDRAFHKEVLQHLRDHRNSAVHSDQVSAEITTLLYQLKRYVEGLLTFHISHSCKFASLEEMISFLDLPSDKTVLSQRKRLIQKRLRFIRT
jgi:hypothetical protein